MKGDLLSLEDRVLDLERRIDAIDTFINAYKHYHISQACHGSRSGLSFEECLQSAIKRKETG
ncbi:MAG: hypothetical protein H8D67_16800 [Deltaproteobacteria bacterium]|nr:hypothetical protein [Deltaproteobacteria bacterium]